MAESTDALSTKLCPDAFTNLQAGYASAVGLIMALISGMVVAIHLIIRRVKQWEI